jgi:catechol 2,3-dioxygenase-like lactoylglutathione lyase family enzyme
MLGVHHLGLSVSKLEDSRDFFCDTLGWEEVRRDSEYPAIFVSNGTVMFTLWQTDPDPSPFDRKRNIGLHHVALSVESEEELGDIYEKLKSSTQVKIEFPPEPLRGGAVQHMICREPSGIRIEFIWFPK